MKLDQIPGWALPAGLGVLVVALVTLALTRGPVSFDPDTPEGTVQEYLTAISEERWDDAIEVFHEDWRGECEGSDLAASAPDRFTAELGSDRSGERIVEETFGPVPPGEDSQVTVPEDVTRVAVTIRHNETGALGTGWSENATFQLVDEEGFWWLVGEPWPYFTWSCGVGR
ncbi:MAG TPA: hypothetical protein VK960_00265 [Acidimicrobiia bacterium]|nr:hypothetical protein [Acidimicrobiia bacterium]